MSVNIMNSKRNILFTLITFLLLNFIWTFLCIKYNEFTDVDTGMLTGFVLLLIFSVSIFLVLQKKVLGLLFF